MISLRDLAPELYSLRKFMISLYNESSSGVVFLKEIDDFLKESRSGARLRKEITDFLKESIFSS